MRMNCPQCHVFLAVDTLHPKTGFRCHSCDHFILPPPPNAAYFSCAHCGLRRTLQAQHAGSLVRCSQCRTINRVDSLHVSAPPPPHAADLKLPPLPFQQFESERRRAPRHALHEVSAYLGLLAGAADVRNISETGASLAIADPEREFHVGERILVDLLFQQQVALEKAPLVVVRHSHSVLGCRFEFDTPALQQQVRNLITRGLMVKQYLRNHVELTFAAPETRFQLREHDPA